jgi:hypothetical protein
MAVAPATGGRTTGFGLKNPLDPETLAPLIVKVRITVFAIASVFVTVIVNDTPPYSGIVTAPGAIPTEKVAWAEGRFDKIRSVGDRMSRIIRADRKKTGSFA